MITSLLEPCLIIPNYAARHLVGAPWLWPAAVCVFSHLHIIDEHVPVLAGYNSRTYAVVLIIQRTVSRREFTLPALPAFFSNLLRSLPKHAAWSVFRPRMWRIYRRTGTNRTYCVKNTLCKRTRWCLYLLNCPFITSYIQLEQNAPHTLEETGFSLFFTWPVGYLLFTF